MAKQATFGGLSRLFKLTDLVNPNNLSNNLQMDPRTNPYAPGAGVTPPEFAGRENILEAADIAFDRVASKRFAKDFMLLGLRGVGKTVLLNKLHNTAKAKNFETTRFEAPEGGLLAQSLVPELKGVLRRLSIREAVEVTLERAGTALRNFAAIFKIAYEGIEFGVSKEPVADSGDLERDLPELLSAVAEAAGRRGRSFGMFIDEVQYLGEAELAAIVKACHEASQQSLPMIFVGAGLPQIAALAGEAKTYAERLFDYPVVGALDEPAARSALAEPAEREGVDFEDDALVEIYRVTDGYPYFLQIWGKYVWDAAEQSPISKSDVVGANADIIEHLDANFFRTRFDRLSPLEQQYMRAMAELGSGPHRTGDIAAALQCESKHVGAVRNRLIQLGMVYSQRHGETAFTVPLFDGFMNRAIPELEPYVPKKRRRS